MNTIVLEHPRLPSPVHFNDIANTPLWSCLMGGYAASALRAAGHATRYLDASGPERTFDGTAAEIMGRPPELLCINAVYFWEHTGKLFDFIGRLRGAGFGGHLNLFGFFPSLVPDDLLREVPGIDSVAVGECEQTLVELADCLTHGGQPGPVAGLALQGQTLPVPRHRRAPADDLNGLPFPLQASLQDGTAAILASRGCYNQCSFCLVPAFYNDGPLWRGRSPENIASEIEGLVADGVRDVYFVDPNFVGPGRRGRERICRLAELLTPLNITFGMETRPNDLDPELLYTLRKAGMQSLLMGIESGSASMLKHLAKGSSMEVSETSIAHCRAVGVEPEIGFIMFLPDSGLADIRANFDFLRRNRLLDRLERTANLLSHYQIVMKGTPGYRRFLQDGRLTPEGVVGFEGQIAYRDPRVAWLRDRVVPACLEALKEMAGEASPIYWGAPSGPAQERVNNELVKLFEDLLQQADLIEK